MILTNAAFFHKYYMFAYTQWMPSAIRDKVDELMNCDDLAMNFLISHIAREPPVKISLTDGTPCKICKQGISMQSNHYSTRSGCLNFFEQVYGYNPLLYTQYRATSLLDENKKGTYCFKDSRTYVPHKPRDDFAEEKTNNFLQI